MDPAGAEPHAPWGDQSRAARHIRRPGAGGLSAHFADLARHALLAAASGDLLSPLIGRLANGVGSILMLHRFADPELGNRGHPIDLLRRNLAYLRKRRFDIVPLDRFVRMLDTPGAKIGRTLALTIDDGYADFATVAAPVFAEFDCPVTVFVVTGPVDRQCWFWWDMIDYATAESPKQAFRIELANGPLSARWSDEGSRRDAILDVAEQLKHIPHADKMPAILDMARALEVELPAIPPPRFAAMTWDQIQACGRGGLVTYGPHTVTHPILITADDATAQYEVTESWRRLRQQTPHAVPIFCYPNGTPDSFSMRSARYAKAIGLDAAVAYTGRYIAQPRGTKGSDAPRYALPRLPYEDDPLEFAKIVNGVARIGLTLRDWRDRLIGRPLAAPPEYPPAGRA